MSGDRCDIKLDPLCELYRQGDHDGRTMSAFNRWILPIFGVVVGVSSVCASNYIVRRPISASMHRHIMAGAFGAFLGEWGHHTRNRFYAERDLQYYHYMTLHPEDFQPPKKIMFRDFIEPWAPIR